LGRIFLNDLLSKKLKAYNPDNSIYPGPNTILPYNKILTYKLTPIDIPVYDANGEIIKRIKRMPEINYDSIYNFRVVQDFYFDFTSEKLYSKLIAFVPCTKLVTSIGTYLGLVNHWGIIFPEEKKKIINKKNN
jgi:hypothetical protein